MIRQEIYIHRYDWQIVVYYDSRWENAPEILRELDRYGVDDRTYYRAANNLNGGLADTGLTYSDKARRFSVIVLSHTSTAAEFANSWVHEIIHFAEHIAEAMGMDYEGEAIAYVGGELARSMHPIASKLMCPSCNHLLG